MNIEMGYLRLHNLRDVDPKLKRDTSEREEAQADGDGVLEPLAGVGETGVHARHCGCWRLGLSFSVDTSGPERSSSDGCAFGSRLTMGESCWGAGDCGCM